MQPTADHEHQQDEHGDGAHRGQHPTDDLHRVIRHAAVLEPPS